MVFPRSRRTLPRFVNGLTLTVPDVTWISTLPCSCLTRPYCLAEPVLDKAAALRQFLGAHASIRPRRAERSGEAGRVLVVGAANVAAGIRRVFEIDVGRRRPNSANLRVAAMRSWFLHVACMARRAECIPHRAGGLLDRRLFGRRFLAGFAFFAMSFSFSSPYRNSYPESKAATISTSPTGTTTSSVMHAQ